MKQIKLINILEEDYVKYSNKRDYLKNVFLNRKGLDSAIKIVENYNKEQDLLKEYECNSVSEMLDFIAELDFLLDDLTFLIYQEQNKK